MFKPSETANDLFRRLHNRSFDLRSKPDRVEQLPFGIAVDVQCAASDISEVSLTRLAGAMNVSLVSYYCPFV